MDRFSARQRIEIALIWAIGLLLLYLFVVSPVITAEHAAARAEREAAEAELARVDAYQRLLLTDERAEPPRGCLAGGAWAGAVYPCSGASCAAQQCDRCRLCTTAARDRGRNYHSAD